MDTFFAAKIVDGRIKSIRRIGGDSSYWESDWYWDGNDFVQDKLAAIMPPNPEQYFLENVSRMKKWRFGR